MKLNKKLILILIAVFIAFSGFFAWRITQNKKSRSEKDSIATLQNDRKNNQNDKVGLTSIKLGGQVLWVETASTSAQKAKGLSGRKSLPKNIGLLFTFKKPEFVSFWMKDMLFPIDIIWIADGQIISIEENVPAPKPGIENKNLLHYEPPKPVDYVLETNAEWCKRNDVGVGHKIVF